MCNYTTQCIMCRLSECRIIIILTFPPDIMCKYLIWLLLFVCTNFSTLLSKI